MGILCIHCTRSWPRSRGHGFLRMNDGASSMPYLALDGGYILATYDVVDKNVGLLRLSSWTDLSRKLKRRLRKASRTPY